MGARDSLPVLGRALRLLNAVAAAREGLTFGEILALYPDAPASTVSRMLKAMLEEKLLAKAENIRKYRLGPAAERLGKVICGRLERGERLRPLVTELAKDIGQSCAYFELRRQRARLSAKHEVPDGFHYMAEGESHDHFLWHGGAKMLLAHQPEKIASEIARRVPDAGKATRAALQRELPSIRAAGVWISRRENQASIARVVAPVFAGDVFAGALLATLAETRDENRLARYAAKVREAAAEASRLLGDS